MGGKLGCDPCSGPAAPVPASLFSVDLSPYRPVAEKRRPEHVRSSHRIGFDVGLLSDGPFWSRLAWHDVMHGKKSHRGLPCTDPTNPGTRGKPMQPPLPFFFSYRTCFCFWSANPSLCGLLLQVLRSPCLVFALARYDATEHGIGYRQLGRPTDTA